MRQFEHQNNHSIYRLYLSKQTRSPWAILIYKCMNHWQKRESLLRTACCLINGKKAETQERASWLSARVSSGRRCWRVCTCEWKLVRIKTLLPPQRICQQPLFTIRGNIISLLENLGRCDLEINVTANTDTPNGTNRHHVSLDGIQSECSIVPKKCNP